MRQPQPWTTANVVAALIIVIVLWLVAYLVSCRDPVAPTITLPEALASQPEPLPGGRLNPDDKDIALALLQQSIHAAVRDHAEQVRLLEQELAESEADRLWLLRHCDGPAWVEYQRDRLGYAERSE